MFILFMMVEHFNSHLVLCEKHVQFKKIEINKQKKSNRQTNISELYTILSQIYRIVNVKTIMCRAATRGALSFA